MTCLLIALINLVPESPLYYLMKNDEIKARDSLKWYRGQIYEDDVEMEELKYLAIVSHSKKVKCLIFYDNYPKKLYLQYYPYRYKTTKIRSS